jgi:carotenoid cleavage dioxygenase-like enzyme
MTMATQPRQLSNWAKMIPQTQANKTTCPVSEFPLTPLALISGTIPSGLRGSLYRNGPAQLERNAQRVGHWFDGDGAILAVHFTDVGATGTYRFVQTAGYVKEKTAGKFLFGGYGMLPSGSYWQRFVKPVKNAANTSVLALPDKLLALWEGGLPHALDLETLDTFGLDHLSVLPNEQPYSAHPKRDPVTGEIYNFGLTYRKSGILNLYRSDALGRIVKTAAIALKGLPMVHDFVLAGRYLLFFVSPVQLNPLALLTRLKSYSDALSWKPERGTQVLVIDRDSLEVVSRSTADPWYQWHYGNGYEDADGNLVVDLVRYDNFQTNRYLAEVATGYSQTRARGTLWQIRLDPKSGRLLEAAEMSDRTAEFPVVNLREVGQPSRFTYLALRRPGVDIGKEPFGAIARFDYQTGTFAEADLGENSYVMEPIYAPDREAPDRGWVMTVVFDGNHDQSEIWIWDGDRLADEPVCRLRLPQVIPLGFHGTWKAA